MSRLIDIEGLRFDEKMTASEIVLILQNRPTVDAVPVVRCRYCRNDCGIVGKSFGPNGYCSMGRKKMEGGE